MPSPAERVRALKQESLSSGGSDADNVEWLNNPIDPVDDALDARGVYMQSTSSADTTVCVWRENGTDDLTFKDPVAGTYTLTQLAAGGGVSLTDFLLDNIPVSPNTTYTVTYTGSKVTQEKWVRTVGATNLKTLDYNYTGTKVTSEVSKVFDTDGSTILGQTTSSYTYSGSTVTGGTVVRNV